MAVTSAPRLSTWHESRCARPMHSVGGLSMWYIFTLWHR